MRSSDAQRTLRVLLWEIVGRASTPAAAETWGTRAFFHRKTRMPDSGVPPIPDVAVEILILGFGGGELKLLLLRWKDGSWSLPGGRVDPGEKLDSAARRVVVDRTGSGKIRLHQFHTYGARDAAPVVPTVENRDHWLLHRTLSVGYLAMIDFQESGANPDSGSVEARWVDVRSLPTLLLDQDEMVAEGLKAVPAQLRDQPIGLTLLPEKFTMPELQKLHEAILGRVLDRRNFKKKVFDSGIVERLPERKRGGAYPAPYLYRFDPARYEQAANDGTLG